MLDNLNQRQKLFAYHYWRGASATDSALQAGYTSHRPSAAVRGSILLKNVKVREAIGTLNNESGITVSSVISNLSRLFNQKNNTIKAKASDIIKISELFLRLEGLDLRKSGTLKPTRSKRQVDSNTISYSLDKLIGVDDIRQANIDNKEEVSSKSIEPFNSSEPEQIKEPVSLDHRYQMREDNYLTIKRAIPKSFPKAVPRPAEVRTQTPAYSIFNFREKDEIDRIQNTCRVYYPA